MSEGVLPVPTQTSGITIAVANRAAATALDTSVLSLGQQVYVTGRPAYYELAASTATSDNIDILATDSSVLRWLRVKTPMLQYTTQAVWEVDYTNGNDEADGLTFGSAIKTRQEWFARTQGQMAVTSTVITMNLHGTVWPTTDRFHYALSQANRNGNTSLFIINGERTVSRAGTCTAASTDPVNTAGGESATITDLAAAALWAADVGKLIVAANGAFAWVLKDLGAGVTGVARVTPWSTAAGGNVAAPPNGTAYSVVTLTKDNIITTPNPFLDAFEVFYVEIQNGLRSAGESIWQVCKFVGTSSWISGQAFTTCLIASGTMNFSRAGTGPWFPSLLIGATGFLNTAVTFEQGAAEFQSCIFQSSPLVVGHNADNSVTPGRTSNAQVHAGGLYGLGFFDCAAGALDVQGTGQVYIGSTTLGLFGKGNATFGTRASLDKGSVVNVRAGYTPTLTGAGVELAMPVVIPALVPGLVVPVAYAGAATWAGWNGAGRLLQGIGAMGFIQGN